MQTLSAVGTRGTPETYPHEMESLTILLVMNPVTPDREWMMGQFTGPYEGSPWEQQRGESERQFARFNDYLDQEPGKRTFTRVAEIHDLDPSSVAEVAKRNRWRERASLYDAHRAKQRRDAIAQQDISLAER